MKVKLTHEGQVTIPAIVRQQLGIQAGDELLLIFTGTEIRLRAIPSRSLSEFYGVLPTTIPYPGREAVRQQVAKTLAREMSSDNKEPRTNDK